jgi:NitT/TauT family transport system substrate-binding protein
MIDRRSLMMGAGGLLAGTVWTGGPMGQALAPAWAGAATPALRVASVKYGSVNWLLETIKAEGIDSRLGLTIEPVELSNNQAGPISLLSGGSDVIVSDWTWALRQRGLGEALKFAPYSATLGAIMVPVASPLVKLEDLEGRRLGVAGSGIDKSWLLLQAYSRKAKGFDLASKATIQFGAAPLLAEQLRDGKLDAVLNFWTQNVRLASLGFRPLLAMSDVMKALEIDPVPAFVGFIWKETTQEAKRPQILALLAAAEAGNAVLAKSDSAWERLRPLTKATSESELAGLRDAYRSGISPPWREADMRSAEKIMDLLISAGDTEFVGAATKFDPKLFHVASS